MGVGYDPQLRPHHRALLERNGVSPVVAHARGYTSIANRADLMRYGFAPMQRARVPGLVAPVFDVRGNQIATAFWPDAPRVELGVMIPFELPPKTGAVLDVSPVARERVADVGTPLYVTDNVLDTDAALSRDLCAVSLLGSKFLTLSLDAHPSDVLRDLPLAKRTVFLCLANDADRRQSGTWQAVRQMFEKAGALVSIVPMPKGLGPAGGLAALFTAGATSGDIEKLAIVPSTIDPMPVSTAQFVARTGQGMIWRKQRPTGVEDVLLANFTARITREIEYDDGVERRLVFEIEADFGDEKFIREVSSTRFATAAWPLEELGARAIVTPPGQVYLRQAIQTLSGRVPRTRVYSSTGWIETADGPAFLHAGGAIGATGPVSGIEVAFTEPLSRYALPTVPDSPTLIQRVRSTLSLLDIVADRVIIPMLAAAFRAVLGNTDTSLFVEGETGVGKTAVAALVLQHFGAALHRKALPASWSSSANALEELAFLAKDVLLVVDDFVGNDSQQVQRLNQTADRLFRAQGNQSGRARMTKDIAFRPPRPPRGVILATGEDVPRGHSLNARILHVRVTKADLDVKSLTDYQQRADRGEFAETMAGFISYIARRKSTLALQPHLEALRAAFDARHARTSEATANVAIGWQIFIEFALEVGAITRAESAELLARGLRTLRELAMSQEELQMTHEPTSRFIALLRATLAGGFAHVADIDGKMPLNPERWGWRDWLSNLAPGSTGPVQPKGPRIGWTDSKNLYLDPDGAYRAAYRLAADGGEPFVRSLSMIKELLWQKGWLVERETKGRTEYLVRRMLEGTRREVLYLDVARFWNDDDGQMGGAELPPVGPTIPTKPDAVGLVGFSKTQTLPLDSTIDASQDGSDEAPDVGEESGL